MVAQERGGVRHQLVPDPLGSTVALYDAAGTKTDTFSYWPYGESHCTDDFFGLSIDVSNSHLLLNS